MVGRGLVESKVKKQGQGQQRRSKARSRSKARRPRGRVNHGWSGLGGGVRLAVGLGGSVLPVSARGVTDFRAGRRSLRTGLGRACRRPARKSVRASPLTGRTDGSPWSKLRWRVSGFGCGTWKLGFMRFACRDWKLGLMGLLAESGNMVGALLSG